MTTAAAVLFAAPWPANRPDEKRATAQQQLLRERVYPLPPKTAARDGTSRPRPQCAGRGSSHYFIGIGNAMKASRRASALVNVAHKRMSFAAPVDLQALVRVYFLDGSSKVLQMHDRSTVEDVLLALKFNLDISDISCFALYCVSGTDIRWLHLREVISAITKPKGGSEQGEEVRLLFRSWIYYKYGGFDNEVFQYGRRIKTLNSALWLAFMEATFLCQSGHYFLTEDESLLLGCLKMQAEAGDFSPQRHTIETIKNRVSNRFPNPVRAKMRALCSPTLGGGNMASELAGRALGMYARLAGKSRAEAQIDYLSSLRTWCPFYGASFFNVQCQYDESPLDSKSSPPTIPMKACIGPLAILLAGADDSASFLRHPYNRIIRWTAHVDKSIFAYWVLKADCSVPDDDSDEGEGEGGGPGKDLRASCDCVYLVSGQVEEIQHLVQSYLQVASDIAPALPEASGDLLPVAAQRTTLVNASAPEPTAPAASEEDQSPQANFPSSSSRNTGRFGRLGSFFSLGTTASASGPGLIDSAAAKAQRQQGYCDDTAAVTNSVFKHAFLALQQHDQDAVTATPQFVANIGELQRMASKADFSDSDEEHSEEGDEDEDEDEDEDKESSAGGDSDSSESQSKPSVQAKANYKAKASPKAKAKAKGRGSSSSSGAGDDSDDPLPPRAPVSSDPKRRSSNLAMRLFGAV